MVYRILTEVVKISKQVIGNPSLPPKYRNLLLNAAAERMPLPPELRKQELTLGHMKALRIAGPQDNKGKVLYYLHGGGYQICSPYTHQSLVYQMVKDVAAHAVIVDYRMAPEFPYPTPVHDAVSGYRWLLEAGHGPEDIIIGGDSAGGGLTLATMLSLKNEGLPLPKAAVVLSPWTDLEGTGDSLTNSAHKDVMISAAGLRLWARDYLQGAHPRNPLASPLYGDLTGLPPLMIEVGQNEVIRDDSVRLYEKARAQGVEVSLKVWPDMLHVFQAFHRFIPEAKESLADIGQFLHKHFHPQKAQVAQAS